jgi:NitT/TauT family transport system substrate-binding protein
LAFLTLLLAVVGLPTIRVGSIGGLANINTLPVSVAMERGFFTELGLEVVIVNQSSIAAACRALISGSLDIGQCTPNEMIPIDRKGGKLVQFDGMWRLENPYYVVTAAGVPSWEQLKGKTVMLSAPKDVTVYLFQRIAKAHGYKLDDFSYAYAGASAARLAALQAGSVQAALLANPTAPLAESQGAHILDSTLSYFPGNDFAGGGWVSSSVWLGAHRDLATAWIRATNKAVAWLYDPANKAAVTQLIATTYKLQNPAVVQRVFESVITTKYFSPTGCTADRAEQGNIRMLVDMALIPPAGYNSADYAPSGYAETAIGRRCH